MGQTGTTSNHAEWRRLYVAAVLETDNGRLKEKLDLAEAAVKGRLNELDGHDTNEEQAELMDATHGLTVLRKERQQKSA